MHYHHLSFFLFYLLKKGCAYTFMNVLSLSFFVLLTLKFLYLYLMSVCCESWKTKSNLRICSQLWPVKLILTVKLGNTNLHNLDAYYRHFLEQFQANMIGTKDAFPLFCFQSQLCNTIPFFSSCQSYPE